MLTGNMQFIKSLLRMLSLTELSSANGNDIYVIVTTCRYCNIFQTALRRKGDPFSKRYSEEKKKEKKNSRSSVPVYCSQCKTDSRATTVNITIGSVKKTVGFAKPGKFFH